MILHPLARQPPHCEGHAIGAILGERHLQALGSSLSSHAPLTGTGEKVVLDFDDIQSATASYLKATLLWLHLCGQLVRGGLSSPFPVRVQNDRPLACELFPFAAHIGPEIRIGLDDVFGGRGLPYLVAHKWDAEDVREAELRGKVEPTVRRALLALLEAGPSSAADLHAVHGARENINLTAWNNRLTELYRLRLARRTKQGRNWLYTPIAGQIQITAVHG